MRFTEAAGILSLSELERIHYIRHTAIRYINLHWNSKRRFKCISRQNRIRFLKIRENLMDYIIKMI